MENNRGSWGSNLGFILAAVGSAVGLGNIWGFPYKMGKSGGFAFLIVYLILAVIVGLTVMASELALGRKTGTGVVGAYKAVSKKYKWVGWLGIISPFLIMSFSSVLGGFQYMFLNFAELGFGLSSLFGAAITGSNTFGAMLENQFGCAMFTFLFVGLCMLIVKGGVSGGIEKFNKVGMPALFIILIVLLARTITLDGAQVGFAYMLSCDWSKVGFNTFLSALGQAFFSLSLGMAIMITYGSYLPKHENLGKNTALICTMDTLVALIAGFIIVPAVFATLGSENVGKGGGFAFASLAGVFEHMAGGAFFGVLFYMLLLFAALTSSISLIEGVVAFLTERFGWKRKPTTIIVCTLMFLIGCLYTMSQAAFNIKGIWFDFANGVSFPIFGDFMEFLTDRLMIPLCALGVCIFTGWIWKPANAVHEIELDGKPFKLAKVYSVLVKYVAPISILLIIVASFVTGTTLS